MNLAQNTPADFPAGVFSYVQVWSRLDNYIRLESSSIMTITNNINA